MQQVFMWDHHWLHIRENSVAFRKASLKLLALRTKLSSCDSVSSPPEDIDNTSSSPVATEHASFLSATLPYKVPADPENSCGKWPMLLLFSRIASYSKVIVDLDACTSLLGQTVQTLVLYTVVLSMLYIFCCEYLIQNMFSM